MLFDPLISMSERERRRHDDRMTLSLAQLAFRPGSRYVIYSALWGQCSLVLFVPAFYRAGRIGLGVVI